MREFKVGERVTTRTIIHCGDVSVPAGTEGIVHRVNERAVIWPYSVEFEDYPVPNADEAWLFAEGELDLVIAKEDPEPRMVFEGGGMREPQDGKPRFDLLFPANVPYEDQFLTRFAVHMAKGAAKYEDRNWEKFSDTEALERAKASALRHIMQWLSGETDEDHAAAVVFNLMAAEHVKRKMENQ